MEPKAHPTNETITPIGTPTINRTTSYNLYRMRISSPTTQATIIFLDVVNDDHDVFKPDIINSVDAAEGINNCNSFSINYYIFSAENLHSGKIITIN